MLAQQLTLAPDAHNREAYRITQALLNLGSRLPQSPPAPQLLPQGKPPNKHDTSRVLSKRTTEKPIVKTEYHIKGNTT